MAYKILNILVKGYLFILNQTLIILKTILKSLMVIKVLAFLSLLTSQEFILVIL